MSKIDVQDGQQTLREVVDTLDPKIREELSKQMPADADHAHVIVAQSTEGGVVPLGAVTYLRTDGGKRAPQYSRAYVENYDRIFRRGNN